MSRITRRNGKQWRLPGAILTMMVFLITGSSLAADLIVDGGATYTVDHDVNFANVVIGGISTGTLNQSGFTHTVTGSIILGNSPGSSGIYNLSGGNLSSNNLITGNQGAGRFMQTGGANTMTGNLVLGYAAGSSGTYSLSGGSNTVAGILFLGYNPGSASTYNLSGGNLTAGFGFVGYQGGGVFNQSGGTNKITNNLQLGYAAGSSGTYNLSGGSLTSSTLYVGKDGSGIFNQSGGNVTVEQKSGVSGLYLGYYPGVSGTYNLSGGSLTAPYVSIGVIRGRGVFNQSGGTSQVTGGLELGNRSGSSGTYNLSGGSLTAGGEIIGYQGLGVFNQSGGSNTLTGDLILGDWSSGSGTYNLSGGILSAVSEIIGSFGSGVFNQSGGINVVSGDLRIGDQFERRGTYALSGGSLFTASTIVGNRGIGTFTQTGGSHTVSNTLALAAVPGSRGTYNLQGGSLTAGSVNLNPGGTFNQTGGSLNAATFNHQGGTVEGTLENRGTFNYINGTFSGRLLNYGTVNFYTDFTAAMGLANYAALGIDAGRTVTLDGAGLDNQGSLVVNGILRGGLLLNGLNGFLSGTGILQGAFTNRGKVSPGNSVGTLNTAGSYTQTASGTLQVQIASATSYSQLQVTGDPGTAGLNGALSPILLNSYRPQPGQVFANVLTAAGGISGAFRTVSNFTPTLVGQALYGDGHIDIMALRNYTNPFLFPLTRNQYAVGATLNSLANTNSGDLNSVLDTIDDHLPDSASVRNAYKQISPDKAAALSTLAFAGANLQRRNLSQRITNLRFGTREISGALGLPGSFNLNSRGAGLMLAFNSSNVSRLVTGRNEPPVTASRWGVYLDPAMVMGSQQSSVDQTGFDFTIAGFNAGADYRVRDDLLVGLATGYSHTGASFQGSGGGVEASTWPLTAYAAYLPRSFYLYGSLGYALNLFNLERHLSFGGLNRQAQSSPTGNQINAYGEAGYDLKVKRLVVTPVLSLAYSTLWVDGFTEGGAGALNLKVSPQQATSLQTGIGGKIALPLKRDGVVVVPQIYATYQHEYADSSRALDARLSQGGNPLAFQTDTAGRNFAVAGASVTILTPKNLKVQLDYNAEVGRSNYTAHYVSAGVRWEF